MIAPLRLPASKSTALPLACREMRPDPAIRAPGRHVEMTFTGPNRASILSSTACTALVRQLRGAPLSSCNPEAHSIEVGPSSELLPARHRCVRQSRSTARASTEVAETPSATPIAAVESRSIMITPGYVEIVGAAELAAHAPLQISSSLSIDGRTQPAAGFTILRSPRLPTRLSVEWTSQWPPNDDDRAGLGASLPRGVVRMGQG